MAEEVVVTGMGVVSCIGLNLDDNRRSLLGSQHGIAPVQYLKTIHRHLPVGEVKCATDDLLKRAAPANPAHWSRTSLLGLLAAREAIGSINDFSVAATGLISATTVGGMDRTEDFYPGFLRNQRSGRLREIAHHECGASTELIAGELGLSDWMTTINTACSSSVNAIMLAVRMIRSGRLDRVVAGGVDGLSRFTLNGFNSLMILDEHLCRPFDTERKGLNLGEGAAFLVIESASSAQRSKRAVLAKISGFANANDAYHQTASSPEGIGAQLAMQRSLKMAGLKTVDIDAINAHGTGTANNDLAEGAAIGAVFGAEIPKVSSTKTFTGHTLGASGAIEAVYSIMSLHEQKVFPNLRLEAAMPEINFEPVRTLENGRIRHIMSNSFGFGGNCSSIIFSEA